MRCIRLLLCWAFALPILFTDTATAEIRHFQQALKLSWEEHYQGSDIQVMLAGNDGSLTH
jgi:hypothetical protein